MAAQIAALGHLAGGGGAPHPSTVLAAAGLIAVAATGLAKRQQSMWAIGAVLMAAQVLFHALFSLSAHEAPATGFDLRAMVVFHAAAALLSTVVLGRGERMLFGLARLWRRVRVWLAAPQPIAPTLWSVRPRSSVLAVSATTVRCCPRRGPPVVTGSALAG